VILKEPFEEAALLVAGALAGCFPEFEDMVEADRVRQEFDSSFEISRTHSGDSIIRPVFFDNGIRASFFSQRKVQADAFHADRDASSDAGDLLNLSDR